MFRLCSIIFIFILGFGLQAKPQCAGAQSITANPAPVNGTYPPNTVVTFCYTMVGYTETNANWVDGFEVGLGPGWAAGSLAGNGPPANCGGGGGNWVWANTVTGSQTGQVNGPGYFFDLSGDGNAGNDYGDQNAANCTWTFCFHATTGPTVGASVSVSVWALGDGTIGSWSSNGCGGSQFYGGSNGWTISGNAVSVTQGPSYCQGQGGNVALTASGANSYSWSPATGLSATTGANVTANPAATTTYTVTGTGGCGTCTATTTITVYPNPTVSVTPTNPVCSGVNSGQVAASGLSGTTPYTYSWNTAPIQTTATATNLGSGNYTVVLTDAHGCTATNSATLTGPPLLTASATATNVTCGGANDGTATAIVFGGTTPYTLGWNSAPPQNTLAATGLPGGNYAFSVQDANGCQATANVVITAPTVITFSHAETNSLCFNSDDGTITFSNAVGGNGVFQYSIDGGATYQASANFTGLAAGNYVLIVRDGSNCTSTTAAVILTEPAGLQLSETHQDISCFGLNDGSIDLTVSGGSVPYVFSWSNAASTEDISALPPNLYTVTVTDANACSQQITVTIIEPALLVLSTTFTDVTCNGGNDGTATGNLVGGTPPYVGGWNTTPPQMVPTAINLVAGIYTFGIQDNNGCQATSSVIISEPALVTFSHAETNASCFGYADGTIAVSNAAGGDGNFQYSINGGGSYLASPSFTGLIAGNYSIQVRDGNNCLGTVAAVVLTEPPGMTVTETHVNVSCFGGNNGSIDVTVNGGTLPYTYLWTNAATTEDLTTLIAGQYDINVTDGNSCSFPLSVTITEPPLFVLTETHQDVPCFGQTNGSIDVTTTGGTTPYTYLWVTGETTEDLNGLVVGTYTPNFTDALGCTATLTINIVEPLAPLDATETHIDVTCFGICDASIDVTTTGGTTPYLFVWTNGASTEDLTALCAGNYDLTVNDANGCPFNLPVTIVEPAAPLSITGITTDAVCNGGNSGSIDITVSGGTSGYTYSWTNGPGTIEDPVNILAGHYTVTATDFTGVCTITGDYDILEPSLVTVTVSPDVTICIGNPTTLTATPAGGTSGGGYTVNWTASPVDASLTNPTALSPQVSPVANTTYTVIASDINGCVSSPESLTVSLAQPLAIIVAVSGSNPICIGDPSSYTFSATGGDGNYSFLLDGTTLITSPETVTPQTTTIYAVTVNDGCGTPSATADVTITVNPLPTILITGGPDLDGCQSLPVSFDASGTTPTGQVFDWNFGDPASSDNTSFDPSPRHLYQDAGTYAITLTVTSVDNCINTQTFPDFVVVRPNPVAGLTPSPAITNILEPNVTVMDESSGASTWSYDFFDGTLATDTNPIHTYTDTGHFNIHQTVTTEYGCTDEADATVFITPVYNLYVPNAFTPNANEKNETFNAKAEGYKPASYEMMVFNRLGEEVFRTKSFENDWDGMSNGRECPLGVYEYRIRVYSAQDFKEKIYMGYVTLVR